MKKTVYAVCGDCCGTGLYEGMCERKGEPVVCLRCEGTGCEVVSYTPFVSRRVIRGVKRVFLPGGRFIATGAGPQGKGMTYAEFQKKYKPPEPEKFLTGKSVRSPLKPAAKKKKAIPGR